MIEIIPATSAHADYLRDNLRSGDRLEVTCLGFSPAEALRASLAGSIFARTGISDGRIAAMWGVGGSPLGGVGEPWLLTTAEVERIPIPMVRVARREVGAMLGLFPELVNYVHAEYRQACRFLEVVGFRLGPAFPFAGSRWHEFRMERVGWGS